MTWRYPCRDIATWSRRRGRTRSAATKSSTRGNASTQPRPDMSFKDLFLFKYSVSQ